MSLDSASSLRLYQQVAERITAWIREGRFLPGQRLPGENDLARELGVSRPSIREAMIALEITGQIEIRSGSGSYVRPLLTTLPLALDVGPGPFELLGARILIEGEIAADAALRASAEDLTTIQATIEEMQAQIESGAKGQAADRHFHTAIAAASKNAVLTGIVDGLWSGMFSPIFHKLSERAGLQHHQAMTLRDHQTIFAAIASRDPQTARSAMRHHLRNVEDILGIDDHQAESGTNL